MRLIDADALPKYTGYALSADEVAMAVENAPTIDAVPVVRCKDCVNFEIDDAEGIEDWCAVTGARTAEDGYCAWGEREED